MMQRDDFENRLSQGLKRWAEAGKPTLDLEAAVTNRLGAPPRRAPGWARRTRWASGLAAAAALVLVVGLTFPTWAGAAAGWPIIGPAVTEIIMKDAGLKWAYEQGILQGTLAEVIDGEITIRILGVMADARRTTVIYQAIGLPPAASPSNRATPAGVMIPPVPESHFSASIATVDGEGGFSSAHPPHETSLGLVGLVSTLPLQRASAELEVVFRVAGRELRVTVPASRIETDRFSREVRVDRTITIDEIAVTLESVVYTPAETIITYQVEKEGYFGPISWEEGESSYIEIGAKRYQPIGGGSGFNYRFITAYPALKGPVTWVMPVNFKGVPIAVTWPLQVGATEQVLGVPVSLTSYTREGRVVRFEWESPASAALSGFAGFKIIGSDGSAQPLHGSWTAESAGTAEGRFRRTYMTELPAGFDPVAVRATTAAVKVQGPWVFEVPR